jgi:dTDP-L-rhamnose 4-epimerase
MRRILVTGGAGFIGSHVTDLLLASGYAVRILDNLSPQVHPLQESPAYLAREAELIVGDIRDRSRVEQALRGIDAVVHLAAAVGVGQSMYEIASYTGTNDLGTAVLLEALSQRPVARLVCASSMSIYGEGSAQRPDGSIVAHAERTANQLRRGQWELQDEDGAPLVPAPTCETKVPSLSSVYALNKYVQEQLCLVAGGAYGIPAIALRFFNVYGPRQALSNPYTGVLAIFAARLLNGRPPLLFEDGRQQRDFVHVSDVAQACLLALETRSGGRAYNIGSGQPRTIVSVAVDLARTLGRGGLAPHVTGKYRAGDIRHCFADIGRAQADLGFVPRSDFRAGLDDLVEWLDRQIAVDSVEEATRELQRRGLVA